MYAFVLITHSWVRWLVVTLTVLAFLRYLSGWLTQRPWRRPDRVLSIAFVAALDLQVLLGLSLYLFLSPIVPRSVPDLKAAMPLSNIRFFAVEHITMMLLALVVAHVTSVRARRVSPDAHKHRGLTWGIGLVLLLLFFAIPWPWAHAPRPLIREF